MLEHYKLENLFNAINGNPQRPGTGIRNLEGLSTKNVQMLTSVLQSLEKVLSPYFDKRREISKEFITKDDSGKSVFTDQVVLQEKLEELAKEQVEFDGGKINLVYGKADKWLTVELNKAFTDVYGEGFNLVDVD